MDKIEKISSTVYLAGYVTVIISIISVIGTTLTMTVL